MAKQTFTTGQVLTAAQMTDLQQTAMTGGAASTKTISYVLVAQDAGTRIAMNAAGTTTITVNTGLFAAGDTVSIQNIGAGVCTITAGTASVNTSGSLVLAQYQGGILYFTSASSAIFFQFATPASGDIEGVTAGVGITGGGTSGTVTITNSMATAIDAKGDLVPGTGADTFARLAVGANDTVLTADSTTATGLKWATPTSGGMTLLSTTTLTSTTTTISSISGAYTNLAIYIYGVTMSADNYLYMRFNSDANANRYFTAGGDQGTAQLFNADKMQLTTFSDATTSKGIVVMTVPFYTDTTIWKLVQRCALMQDDTNNNNLTFSNRINAYNQTGAITSITILTDGGASFTAGTVKIYGVK